MSKRNRYNITGLKSNVERLPDGSLQFEPQRCTVTKEAVPFLEDKDIAKSFIREVHSLSKQLRTTEKILVEFERPCLFFRIYSYTGDCISQVRVVIPEFRQEFYDSLKQDNVNMTVTTVNTPDPKVSKKRRSKKPEREWTKEKVRDLLDKRDDAVIKGMIRIWEHQTAYEKKVKATTDHNNVGFTGVDGDIMCSFVDFYKKNGFLSQKQLTLARKKMRKYAGQLVKIIYNEI